MDLFDQPWFRMSGARMDWAAARQRELASNVANADTPGYIGSDVVSFEEHLERTAGGGRPTVRTEAAANSWGGSFDGNRVVLEEQLMLSNEAAGQFSLASSLYKKGHSLIGIAASAR